jgi:anti-sigma factor RsiW
VVPQKKGRRKKAVRATARSIESAERTARALELRKGGATYAMIGEDLGVSEARAHQIVNDALTAIVAEPAEKVRKLEIERIDHMLSVAWATATNAMSEVTTVDASSLDMILKAQAGVLKLMERRAKLTGLDAPEKVEEVGPPAQSRETVLASH